MARSMIVSWGAGLFALTSTLAWAQEDAQPAGDLQEIVVTAQRREENAQKTSLALEVLSADAINKAGVTDPASIANLVSGVNIVFAGATPQTYIRGVGSNVTNGFADSAIAYSMDGVYISRSEAISGLFYDLERIEVLKGPQGTLYGRNASGGAINLISKKPTDELGGDVSVETGDYDLVKVSGALNVPVSDVLDLRGAFQVNRRNGYEYGGYDDDDTRAGRFQALLKPNSEVSLLLSADAAHIGGKGATGIRRGPGDPSTDDPWHDRAASAPGGLPSYRLAAPWAGDLYAPDNSGFVDTHTSNVSAQLDWKLPWATLTVLPAYRVMVANQRTFAPGFLFDDRETSRQKTLEVRLGNSTEWLKWVAGAYYFREHQTQDWFVNQGVNITSVDTPNLDTSSAAVFDEITYSVLPSLRFILGERYTHEAKLEAGTQDNTTPYPTFVYNYLFPPALQSGVNYDCNAPYLPPPAPQPKPSVCTLPVTGRTSAGKVTWKTGLEYDLTAENMLFFTASEGFKAGGVFNTKKSDPTYKPEELLAFEFGSRNRFFDNRLQINLETFYWKYRDKQEASVRYDPVDGLGFIIRNAARATMYGENVELAWQITRQDRFDVGAEYLHSKYGDFTYVLSQGGTTGCTETPRSDGNFTIDCTGKQLPKAPQWSGNVGFSHIFELPRGELTASVSDQYSSSTILDITYGQLSQMGSWSIVDAYLRYDAPKQTWSVTGWIRNIGDKAVYTGGGLYPFAAGVYYETIRPPRTFGARLAVNF